MKHANSQSCKPDPLTNHSAIAYTEIVPFPDSGQNVYSIWEEHGF